MLVGVFQSVIHGEITAQMTTVTNLLLGASLQHCITWLAVLSASINPSLSPPLLHTVTVAAHLVFSRSILTTSHTSQTSRTPLCSFPVVYPFVTLLLFYYVFYQGTGNFLCLTHDSIMHAFHAKNVITEYTSQ